MLSTPVKGINRLRNLIYFVIFFSNVLELSGLLGTASQDTTGSPQTKTMKDYEYVSTHNIVCFPPVTNKEKKLPDDK